MSVVEFKRDGQSPVEQSTETTDNQDQKTPSMWRLLRDLYHLTYAYKWDVVCAMLLSAVLAAIGTIYQLPWTWAYDSIGKGVLFGEDHYFLKLVFYATVLWALSDIFLPYTQKRFIRVRILPQITGTLAINAMSRIASDYDVHKNIEPVRLKTTRDQIGTTCENVMTEGANIIRGLLLFIYFAYDSLFVGTMPVIGYTLIVGMAIYVFTTHVVNVVMEKHTSAWNQAQSDLQTAEIETVHKIRAKKKAEEKESQRGILPSWTKKVPIMSPAFVIVEECREFLATLDKLVISSEEYQTNWLMFDILLRSFSMLATKIICCFSLIYYADAGIITIGQIALFLDWILKSGEPLTLGSALHEKLTMLKGNIGTYPVTVSTKKYHKKNQHLPKG